MITFFTTHFKIIKQKTNKYQHRHNKDLDLIIKILSHYADENTIVLDPFIGSGTTAVACEILKCKWIGIEIDEGHCKIIKKRIKEYTLQNKLF